MRQNAARRQLRPSRKVPFEDRLAAVPLCGLWAEAP